VGKIKKGPGGSLHDFLTAHADDHSRPLIIINYANFTPSEIVRFNSLLDDERKADGTPLPEDASVIGLIDPNKPNAYRGSDFLSRFDEVQACTIPRDKLPTTPFVPSDETPVDNENLEVINLFGGADWKSQLLGHWELQGKELHFVEGKLVSALRKGKTHIELRNAPWHKEDFVRFWEDTALHDKVKVDGEEFHLPTIYQSKGYLWDDYKDIVTINEEEHIPDTATVLNPNTKGEFSRTASTFSMRP